MHQNDGNAAGLAGLHQGQYLREFIERTEAAGQHHVGRGVFDEHDLARKEMAEVDGDILVLVGGLLLRQDDVDADAGRLARITTLVRGLHQTRSAAAHHAETGIRQCAGDVFRQLVIGVILRRARGAEDAHGGLYLREPLETFDELRHDLENLPRLTAEQRVIDRHEAGVNSAVFLVHTHLDLVIPRNCYRHAGGGFLGTIPSSRIHLQHSADTTMTSTPIKPLVLVDGSSYLYRAFYALPPLTNSSGKPTGAVYGVLNMLRKLVADYDPEYVAVVFDAKGKTFRDDLLEQYKAQRPPMPDDLVAQIEPLHEAVRASGLPCLVVDGVEADDVIGTLTVRATRQGLPVLISTGDKDMAQLVDGRATLINTMSNSVLDRDGVIAKFGIPPERIVDYLALIGASSDNIPGIPQVGPKTAVKWLTTYGSLDEVIARAGEISGRDGELSGRAGEISGRAGDNLRAHLAQLPLARQLATIHCDVRLDVDITDLRRRAPDKEALTELYRRLEFKTWLRQLQKESTEPADASGPAPAPSPPAAHAAGYETVVSDGALEKWLDRLRGAELFAFDTETTSLNYMQAEIVGVSFSITAGEAAYVPLAHDYSGAPAQLARDEVLARLKPLLEDPARAKLGHNLKYDMSVLANHGIALAGVRYDTMLESYVLNSTASRHDMDTLAKKHLDYQPITFEDIAGKGAKQLTINQIPLDQAAPSAAEDADITLRLHHTLWPTLDQAAALKSLVEDIEVPLVSVLSRMERAGVLVDVAMK